MQSSLLLLDTELNLMHKHKKLMCCTLLYHFLTSTLNLMYTCTLKMHFNKIFYSDIYYLSLWLSD